MKEKTISSAELYEKINYFREKEGYKLKIEIPKEDKAYKCFDEEVAKILKNESLLVRQAVMNDLEREYLESELRISKTIKLNYTKEVKNIFDILGRDPSFYSLIELQNIYELSLKSKNLIDLINKNKELFTEESNIVEVLNKIIDIDNMNLFRG